LFIQKYFFLSKTWKTFDILNCQTLQFFCSQFEWCICGKQTRDGLFYFISFDEEDKESHSCQLGWKKKKRSLPKKISSVERISKMLLYHEKKSEVRLQSFWMSTTTNKTCLVDWTFFYIFTLHVLLTIMAKTYKWFLFNFFFRQTERRDRNSRSSGHAQKGRNFSG